ncbi:MAG TPA: hypothetical protein VHL52_04750 [Acidimicrobiia bacterium]|nr:hypothetical protein [Acidimicrobiia bacterium]
MDSYSGPVRILDSNGILLTVGSADLELDRDRGSWGGLLRVIANTGVAGKALRVRIEIPDGRVGDAALDPRPAANGIAFSEIAGIGPAPF